MKYITFIRVTHRLNDQITVILSKTRTINPYDGSFDSTTISILETARDFPQYCDIWMGKVENTIGTVFRIDEEHPLIPGDNFSVDSEPIDIVENTCKYWLSKLPKKIKRQVEQYAISSLYAHSVAGALIHAFNWNNTKEGSTYWNTIFEKYSK